MKRLLPVLILVAVAAGLASCDYEKGQSILIISSIDQTSSPFGDTLSNDGTVPSDTIDITFANDVKNPAGFADTTQADIIISAVTVTYNRIDGGSDRPSPLRNAITLRVPANGVARLTGFPVFPATKKLEFPVSDLVFFGFERSTNFTSIRVDAIIEIEAKTIEGDPVYARGNITIELTDWAD